MSIINWHQKHIETSSIGDRLSDAVTNGMGSWKFIIWQTNIVLIWMALNIIAYIHIGIPTLLFYLISFFLHRPHMQHPLL